MVPALNLVAPMKAKDVASAPLMTEVIEDVYPYQIAERQAAKIYREVDLPPEGDDDESPRTLLEQHRMMDLDGDGVPEPYIITVDKVSSEVLRFESNFSIKEAMQGGTRVKKLSAYYVKYDFFPHPKGCFYGIGFGHLLDPLVEVINTSVNQLIDAGTAQIAGGGFIAGGVRLQGNSSRVRMQPGEFKVINGVTGSQLKDAIFERTVPEPSTVAYQLLDMMLGAAKEIASVKDVVTGDASNMGQVGTTMAMIEHGLQVFSAIYKRVYRSLKAEFQMVFDCLGRWGGQTVAQDYMNVLDDPAANFQADFNGADFDIRPVSDPSSVTRMQKMARAAFLQQFLGRGLNDMEIYRRIFEAADVEDIDKLFPDPQQMAMQQGIQNQLQQLQPQMAAAKMANDQGSAMHKQAMAQHTQARAVRETVETQMEMNGITPGAPPPEPEGGLLSPEFATVQQKMASARASNAQAQKTEMESEVLAEQYRKYGPDLAPTDKVIVRE
jgi:chaperonin GroES